MGNKGFTLVELILVILLSGIVAGAVVNVMFQGVEGWLSVGPRKETLGDIRPAMERMVREIREGRRYDYSLPTNQRLEFNTYTSQFDLTPRLIIYECTGGRIDRTEGLSTNTLAENISFCNFSTYAPNLIRLGLGSTLSGKTTELREIAFFRNYTGQE